VALLKVDPRYSTLVHLGTLAAMLIAGYDRSVTLWTGGTTMGLTNVELWPKFIEAAGLPLPSSRRLVAG
jgi:hypothetical protein